MSLLSKVEGFFQSVGSHVKAAFVAVFGDQAGAELASAAESWAKTELGQVAMTVVQGLESAAGATGDKRQLAFDQIGQQLKAQGQSVPSSLINFAIEFALQVIRGGATASAAKA